MSFLTKLSGMRIPGVEVAAIRFACGLVVILLLAWARIVHIRIERPFVPLLLVRGFCGGIAVVLFFTAIVKGDLGMATLLNFTSPVFTALFAWIFLRERMSRWGVGALLLSGVGVTLVWRGSHAGPVSLMGWHTLGLLSAAFAGAAVAAMRGLRHGLAVGSFTVFFVFNVAGLLVALPFAVAHWVWPDVRETAFLLGMAALSILGQILFTHALAHVQAALSGVIQQLTVIVAMALGTLVLGERLGPLELLGAALTMAGAAWAAKANRLPATCRNSPVCP